MNRAKEIIKALENVPNEIALPVLADISKRIMDWLASGGKHDDPYIEQQVDYAKSVGALSEKVEVSE